MLAISIGDINGVGIEIALRAHKYISRFCTPHYIVHRELVESASALLGLEVPSDMRCVASFEARELSRLIEPSSISARSGAYSFESFMEGVRRTHSGEFQALVTLPIHKAAWAKAGIESIGHTDALRAYFGRDSIMMLGTQAMFVALFSDHIALREVSECVSERSVREFLLAFARCVNLSEPCCVLGLNPHCGDEGLMGDEDSHISAAVKGANRELGRELFFGAYPPDSAFAPHNRARFRFYVSMYHDVGLAPLKALYFEESINVSLNLPILRTSVDHGVAFDRAYGRGEAVSLTSYINAVKYALDRQA